MCDGVDTWTVIKNNDDFNDDNFKPLPNDNPPSTTFEVVRPEEARYKRQYQVSNHNVKKE